MDDSGRRRAWLRWPVLVLAAGTVSAAGAGQALADENYHGSPLGPQVALVKVGQVDDPMEDVLEHVSFLGDNLIVD